MHAARRIWSEPLMKAEFRSSRKPFSRRSGMRQGNEGAVVMNRLKNNCQAFCSMVKWIIADMLCIGEYTGSLTKEVRQRMQSWGEEAQKKCGASRNQSECSGKNDRL